MTGATVRYAVRAVAWPELLGATAVLGLSLAVLVQWPSLWRSLGLSVVALIAIGAWVMDEPAAAVVDAAPRPLRWRTLARLLAVLPAAALWLGFALHEGALPAPHQAAGHTDVLLLIGAGGLLLGAAGATLQRSRGRATPGQQTALIVGLLVAALSAFPRHLPLRPSLFPTAGTHEWIWAGEFWTIVIVVSALVLGVATSPRAVPGARWGAWSPQ